MDNNPHHEQRDFLYINLDTMHNNEQHFEFIQTNTKKYEEKMNKLNQFETIIFIVISIINLLILIDGIFFRSSLMCLIYYMTQILLLFIVLLCHYKKKKVIEDYTNFIRKNQ